MTNKKQIKSIFREGNKLGKAFVNSTINPLRIPRNAESKFIKFVDKLEPKLKNYFTELVSREIDIACSRYHRPVLRGRDGMLYSASDMDHAMMMYS